MEAAAIFIVIPAYNEQEVLRPIVEQLCEKGYSVVVVDDGSSQPQSQFLEKLPYHYLRHSCNLGQGAALQTGTAFALSKGASYIVHFDSDGQHLVSDIGILLEPLQQNTADIVFGSRFINNQGGDIPMAKRIIIHTARVLNYMFTGLLLSDAHNGLRAANRQAANLLRLTENRMSHASEILFLVKKHRLRFMEVPVRILYTDYSKKKGAIHLEQHPYCFRFTFT